MTSNEGDLDCIVFENEYEAFLGREIAEGEDENVGEKYRQLEKKYFGDLSSVDELVDKFRQAVKEKKWIVPNRTAFYVKFLRAGDCTVDGAMKVLKEYIAQRTDCPHYFKITLPSKIQWIADFKLHVVLPYRDQNGRRIIYYRPGRWDPGKLKFCDAYGVGCMIGELVALEPKTQIAGVTAIANAQDFGFRHFRAVTLDDIKNGANLIQDSFPLFFRAIHIINAPRLFVVIFNLVKQFLNDSVKESIIFHSDLASLHRFVSPDILPTCLGGSTGECDNKECFDAINKMEDFFLELRTIGFGNGNKN